MAEFTKERLEEIAELAKKATYKPCAMHMTNLLVVCDSEVIEEMARQLLASMEQEPVAYYFPGGEREIEQVSLPDDLDDEQKANCIPLYAAPQLPQPAVPESPPEHLLPQGSSRDAIRYQFLRDKDAFGNENEPGLASWDDLAELEGDAFDAAVDARMADADIPAYNTPQEPEVKADAEIYAELYRLRAEIKGPDGFDTWKDAAISEKKARIACEKRIPEIDYLTAMGAFHSDEWHKMGSITGYMYGWNACRAAMLQGAEPVSQPYTLPANAIDALEKALQAMSFMGDTLNALDAVCEEDVEYVTPAFEAVREVLEFAEPTQGWIPCSERMPEEIGRYWCYVEEQNSLGKSHYQWNCSWNGDRWWVESENGGRVTHWMPLQEPPKQTAES